MFNIGKNSFHIQNSYNVGKIFIFGCFIHPFFYLFMQCLSIKFIQGIIHRIYFGFQRCSLLLNFHEIFVEIKMVKYYNIVLEN